MWEIRFARYTAKWSLKKRLLFVVLLCAGMAIGLVVFFSLAIIWDKWKLQEPQYSVGIENIAIQLLNRPHMLFREKNFDRNGLLISFVKELKKPFCKSAMHKIPTTDAEQIFWRWSCDAPYWEGTTLEKLHKSVKDARNDFYVLATAPIANDYLNHVWRYKAVETASAYIMQNIEKAGLSGHEKRSLRKTIIENRLSLIKVMQVEKFIKGKYSPLLHEEAPVPDEDKYMPLRFLFKTYEYIVSTKPFDCNNPFINEIFPLQDKMNAVLERYKTVSFSPEYQAYLREDSAAIKNILDGNTRTLKKECNLS